MFYILCLFLSIVSAQMFLVPFARLTSPMDIRVSLSGLYTALLTASLSLLPLCLLQSLTSLQTLFLVAVAVAAAVCLRLQVGVSDSDYVRDMLERHSSSLLVSQIRAGRSTNPGIRTLADQIVRTHTIERKLMKEL